MQEGATLLAVFFDEALSLHWLTWAVFFQVAVSVTTIAGQWQMGNKVWWAPAIGLLSIAMWIGFIVTNETWWLLISASFMAVVYARNLRKWRRERGAG